LQRLGLSSSFGLLCSLLNIEFQSLPC
jgi:hypothetical protein